MGLLEDFRASVAQLQPAVTFKAWRILSDGLAQPLPTDGDNADGIADAIAVAVPVGSTLAILMEDAARRVKVLRFAKTARRNVTKRWSQATCSYVESASHYAKTLIEQRVENYAPAEVFAALRDCPVGHDRTLLEQSA